MGTIKDGTTNPDSQHQLWKWLLHKLQGAFCNWSDVCQTDAAMISICVWVMLKGCLLTPERFSGAAVATQPNFISALFWEKEQLLCWREKHLMCCRFINMEISKSYEDKSQSKAPLTALISQSFETVPPVLLSEWTELFRLNSDAVGRLKLDFTHFCKNKSNKRLITSRWLILCCVIKSPGLTPTSNHTPLFHILLQIHPCLNPIFLEDFIRFLSVVLFLSDEWSHITAMFAWIWVCQSRLILLLVSS